MSGSDSGTSAEAGIVADMDTQFTPLLALRVAAPSMLVAIERSQALSIEEVDRSTRAQPPLTKQSPNWARS
jgi:hypothetical protein